MTRARSFAAVLLAVALFADVALRLLGAGSAPVLAQGAPPEARERRRDATVRAVEKAGPAVANIATERVIVERFPSGLPAGFEEFFRDFNGRGAERRTVARSL